MVSLSTISWALVGIGAAYWTATLAAGVHTTRRLACVGDTSVPAVDPASSRELPIVSVVVAARDEAASIRAIIDSVAALDYPATELVLVDDRSTDATPQLVDAAARRFANVRAVHVRELPEGWLGKVHALQRGVDTATGDWLLFADADVQLAPDAVTCAVAFAQHEHLDHLGVLPAIDADGVLIAGAVSVFARWLVVGGRLWRAADPDDPAAFGVGAFNLVRADALRRAGGFEWLRLDVADDAALALLISRTGGRSQLAQGARLARVRWQESIAGMMRGFEKYGSTGGAGTHLGAVTAVTAAAAAELAPVAALLLGRGGPASIAAAGVLLVAGAAGAVLGRQTGMPLRSLLVLPVAAALVWFMQVRASWLEWRRGGLVWRDTFYPTPQLRAGKRFRMP